MSTLDRVRLKIRQRRLFDEGETVVVAVSGGPDSLTLLHVLHAMAPEFGLRLHVAHFNHMLRGKESDADAEFVQGIAEKWQLDITVEAKPALEYARDKKLSLEEAARILRYRFLGETARTVGARSIALGHNADDQVETILMHFLRGSGLAGLRGMLIRAQLAPELRPARNDRDIWLVRPLLDITRTEIIDYCNQEGLKPRQDTSNLELTPFRNRLRHQVLPQLKALNPNLRQVILHTAETVADDYQYLNDQAEAAFSQVAHPERGSVTFDRGLWADLPPALQRATLRESVRLLRESLRNINWIHIEGARRVALEGATGAEATLPDGLVLRVGYGEFSVGESLPLPDSPRLLGHSVDIVPGASPILPDGTWKVSAEGPLTVTAEVATVSRDKWCAEIDAERVEGDMYLRTRRPGDRLQPEGLGGHSKSLHDFMIDRKIPRAWRDQIPLLCDRTKILWICGYRVDERVKRTSSTRRLYRVSFTRIAR